ncbi:MAG: phosphoribosylaminoimidazolesuccinocarboxamide synthase [Armatimonadota bacterium]
MSDRPEQAVLETDLPGAISRRQGKVRDIYEYPEGVLIVASDRISAFDVIMPNGVPGKGKVLCGLSVFWFALTKDIVPNHLLSAEVKDFPAAVQPQADILAGRSMWCKKAQVVPIECVVRGYLAGSGWKSYQKTGEVCGHKLPPGLVESAQLPEPIFTPTTKEESGHDMPVTMAEVRDQIGTELANKLMDVSLSVYSFARDFAAQRGFILCDTKFEFGMIDGQLTLVDEILTPDSSRYWDASKYAPGRPQESFDKQYVRDYLETLDWNKEPPAPELPGEVVAETRRIYQEAYRRITGMEPPG